jgi:hypothetical protein
MTVNIEKMRFDIEESRRRGDAEAERWRANQSWEFWKFLLQMVAALGTAMAGGAGLLALILHLTGKI